MMDAVRNQFVTGFQSRALGRGGSAVVGPNQGPIALCGLLGPRVDHQEPSDPGQQAGPTTPPIQSFDIFLPTRHAVSHVRRHGPPREGAGGAGGTRCRRSQIKAGVASTRWCHRPASGRLFMTSSEPLTTITAPPHHRTTVPLHHRHHHHRTTIAPPSQYGTNTPPPLSLGLPCRVPCHALPCPALPCHAVSCHTMPRHATPRHATLRRSRSPLDPIHRPTQAMAALSVNGEAMGGRTEGDLTREEMMEVHTTPHHPPPMHPTHTLSAPDAPHPTHPFPRPLPPFPSTLTALL